MRRIPDRRGHRCRPRAFGGRGLRQRRQRQEQQRSTTTGPDINAKGEGKLDIVGWEGYTDPSWVKQFEKQTGCKVNSVYAGTSDEMFTKFNSGGGGQFDLASFSGDASVRAIRSGSLGRWTRRS